MKKALTIILTLILGFGANFLISLGLLCLALFVTDDSPLWYAAALAVVAAFTALLNFLRGKLKNLVHGAAFILCAQLPSVIFCAADLAQCVHYYKTTDFRNGFDRLGAGISAFMSGASLAVAAAVTAAAFIVWAVSANKDALKKWWNEPYK